MSTPGPPIPCTLAEPPGCCPPTTVNFIEHWRNEWPGPGPNPVSCCNTAYPASLSISSDSPTETVWTGQFNGTDICGNVLVLNYILTRNKSTDLCTAERPGAGASSKSGLYGTYPELGPQAGICGDVFIQYGVTV